MTFEKTEAIADLFRDLVGSYTSKPDELELFIKEVPGAVYFKFRVHGDDHRVAVGSKGSHVDALSLIFSEIGENAGAPLVLTLLEPDVRSPRNMPLPPVTPKIRFNFMPAQALLIRLINALGVVEVKFEVEEKIDLERKAQAEIMFKIFVRSSDDYARLTVPMAQKYGAKIPALIAALGTLFRAYAMKEGVRFDLEVIQS
jgi:predicted RNA-binding protein YlqC (UPF0109 family)